MPTDKPVLDPSSWLAEAWADSFASVLEAMTGERPEVAVSASPAVEQEPEDLKWWRQELDVRGGAVFWIGSPKAGRLHAGATALKAAGVDEANDEDSEGTYQELIQQSISTLTQSLGTLFGQEISCLNGEYVADGPGQPAAVETHMVDQPACSQLLYFSSELLAAFGNAKLAISAPDEGGKEIASRSEPASAPPGSSRPIDLILDVEMPVSISFGRAHLPLRDVLKLTSGSIVEMNRAVAEPVEVIVNNCVIARGEVVVVEGNYGVRISQIVSRRERLRTLN